MDIYSLTTYSLFAAIVTHDKKNKKKGLTNKIRKSF